MKRRRALVLAYLFPPLGGAGVQRTLKFVRYLEPLGWEATVVSTKSRHYPARDPSLLEEIPRSAQVVRTRALPLAGWLSLVSYHLGLKRVSAYLSWPDGGIGWMPFAFAAALRRVHRDRPDVVFSTSAPYGNHLVALLLARLTGIPWVADFRDEWTANPHLVDQPRLLARFSERAERAITREATKVTVAASYFQLRGLADDDPKRIEIANGVDEDDFSKGSETAPPLDRFVLSHVGTLYDLQDPSAALRVLAALGARHAVDVERVEVRLVGNVWIPDFAPPPGVRVEQTGYVDHGRAIAEMCAATVLLLYVPASSLAPSGKLFEYLASGRPILCLTGPDNLASRLVREWEAGVVADPHDEVAIEQALLTLWQRWQKDGLPDQAEVRRKTLERYSRRKNAEQLARVLDEAASG
jgi:glycosyltransferase involved in cell wall biosynthesis